MRVLKSIRLLLVGLVPFGVTLMGADSNAEPKGLNPQAARELSDAGLDKYLGAFTQEGGRIGQLRDGLSEDRFDSFNVESPGQFHTRDEFDGLFDS